MRITFIALAAMVLAVFAFLASAGHAADNEARGTQSLRWFKCTDDVCENTAMGLNCQLLHQTCAVNTYNQCTGASLIKCWKKQWFDVTA